VPAYLDPEAHEFMRVCLDKDPAKRPIGTELFSIPWLAHQADEYSDQRDGSVHYARCYSEVNDDQLGFTGRDGGAASEQEVARLFGTSQGGSASTKLVEVKSAKAGTPASFAEMQPRARPQGHPAGAAAGHGPGQQPRRAVQPPAVPPEPRVEAIRTYEVRPGSPERGYGISSDRTMDALDNCLAQTDQSPTHLTSDTEPGLSLPPPEEEDEEEDNDEKSEAASAGGEEVDGEPPSSSSSDDLANHSYGEEETGRGDWHYHE